MTSSSIRTRTARWSTRTPAGSFSWVRVTSSEASYSNREVRRATLSALGNVARRVRQPGGAAMIATMRLPAGLRGIILAATMTLMTSLATAAGVTTAEPEGETLRLWPGGAPGAGHVTTREVFTERAPGGPLRDRIVEHVTQPALVWFHAHAPANGVTLLIVPGGGYARVVIDKEGFESAQWFAARGFDCAVLRYRLPADGWLA